MNKWTWLALVAFVAVLGGSYYLLQAPKGKLGAEMGKGPDGELNVEDFDTPDAGDEADHGGDNTYDMLDDPDAAGQSTPGQRPETAGAAHGSKVGTAQVETIDDADDKGETVGGPVVIEDNDESIEPAKPKAKQP